jgi:predicted GIY-YIG superfamily endonuclease
MITIYVLQSLKANIRYVGITKDLNKRLKEHNAGKSTYTSSYRPWKIIYTESAIDFTDARKREKYLKSAAGKKFLQKILPDSSLSTDG